MGHNILVCDSSKTIETAFKHVEKTYKKFVTLAIISGVYVAVSEMRSKKQDKKIKELCKELEELKNAKGD